MALCPQQQKGTDGKFLDLLTTELDTKAGFYFVLCGRFYIGDQCGRVFLHRALVTESQKLNCKRIIEANGEIARLQWTIVLKFSAENWCSFKQKTAEREVYFECLFKRPGRNPTFAPVFAFPTIGKQEKYTIASTDFCGNAILGFRRGGIKVKQNEDGTTVLLIRLEERGFTPLCHYVVIDQ